MSFSEEFDINKKSDFISCFVMISLLRDENASHTRYLRAGKMLRLGHCIFTSICPKLKGTYSIKSSFARKPIYIKPRVYTLSPKKSHKIFNSLFTQTELF